MKKKYEKVKIVISTVEIEKGYIVTTVRGTSSCEDLIKINNDNEWV